ncbi:uncharacterized protein LOC141642519 [Silene latifolia]|uniref:uncharacterized protein LOC141642519 n=1 Tax=Silene latifolia TaxID=37657 RepID=UPI003D7845C6
MEGVGARLGRSSSRYGTTTVFTGPVRKWQKNWVPITPPPPPSSSSHHLHHSHSNHNNSNASNNSSASHLRLFKWTPLSKDNNNKDDNNNSNSPNGIKRVSPSDDSPTDDVVSHEPPRRKFKFIPIAVLEEKKKENEEKSDDEAKNIDTDGDEQGSKGDDIDEKPDINDVPMEENQDSEENQTPPARQDLNELDLSLGLTSHEDDHDSDS